MKFKNGDKVIIKEVHESYCRPEDGIRSLKTLCKERSVGKVSMIDEEDSKLNVYVVFAQAYSQAWFNEDELELFEEDEFEDIPLEPLEGQDEKDEINNILKAQLLDFLIKEGEINFNEVLERYRIDSVVTRYTDELIQYSLDDEIVEKLNKEELKEIVRCLLEAVAIDFDMDIFKK